MSAPSTLLPLESSIQSFVFAIAIFRRYLGRPQHHHNTHVGIARDVMTGQAPDGRPRPPTRPEHSEAYWQAMKYLIIGLAALMILTPVLAVIVLLRAIPWG